MGLFSTKKTIKVSSTVYNLAGDEADRNNFLKTSIFSAVMSPYDVYLGETVVGNHLNGPGIKQRQFQAWAKRNSFAGLPSLSVARELSVDPAVVGPEIPVPTDPAGLTTICQSASISDGDFTYFAEQYVLQNSPELIDTDYASEYDKDTHTIIIQYEGGATDVVPAGIYSSTEQYVVANFYQTLVSEAEPVETGTLVVDQDLVDLPDNTGFVSQGLTNTGVVSYALVYDETVTKTYSDATPQDGPTTTAVSESIDFNGTEEIFTKSEFYGNDDGQAQTSDIETFNVIYERRQAVNRISTTTVTNDIGGGVTETVTTTIDGDHLDEIYDYRVDTQETINSKVIGGEQMFIYQIGSGNVTLDALAEDVTTTGVAEFYPFIPVRLNNVSIYDPVYDDDTGNGLYEESRIAYRKAAGTNGFADLVDQVEDNEELGEIDYAYVAFGVSLNTTENACLKYAYQFFEGLIPYQNTNGSYMDTFIAGVGTYDVDQSAYDDWKAAQIVGQEANPLHGTAAPAVPSLAKPETTTLKLQTTDARTTDSDNRLSWVSIDEEFFTGLAKVDAKNNEVWMEKSDVFAWTEPAGLGTRAENNQIEKIYVYWQIDQNNYKRLTIYGLIHQNFIYQGKSVNTTAHEALDDTDTSGFLLPLHDPTVRSMNLVDSTQMALANTFIVFNSYKVYKKKWYQTFFGMLFIILVVVIAAALIAPAAVGGATGAFGTNAAVGAGFGLTGTAAVVAGAVTNAIAGIVISTAISAASTEIFGEKWGAFIGALATFAVTFGMSGGFSNFSMSTIMNPQNLLAFSSALANGYEGYIQADIAEMQLNAEASAAKYKDEMEELNQMIRDLGGSNDLSFDPMQLTDVNAGNGQGTGSYIPESLDEFIHRTTMSGSDIVDVTLSMVENYADLNLQLPSN